MLVWPAAIVSLATASHVLQRFIVQQTLRIQSLVQLVRSAWHPRQHLPPVQEAISASMVSLVRALLVISALLVPRRRLLVQMVRSAMLCPLLQQPVPQATSARTEPPRHALLVPTAVLAARLRPRVLQGPIRQLAPLLLFRVQLAVSA